MHTLGYTQVSGGSGVWQGDCFPGHAHGHVRLVLVYRPVAHPLDTCHRMGRRRACRRQPRLWRLGQHRACGRVCRPWPRICDDDDRDKLVLGPLCCTCLRSAIQHTPREMRALLFALKRGPPCMFAGARLGHVTQVDHALRRVLAALLVRMRYLARARTRSRTPTHARVQREHVMHMLAMPIACYAALHGRYDVTASGQITSRFTADLSTVDTLLAQQIDNLIQMTFMSLILVAFVASTSCACTCLWFHCASSA